RIKAHQPPRHRANRRRRRERSARLRRMTEQRVNRGGVISHIEPLRLELPQPRNLRARFVFAVHLRVSPPEIGAAAGTRRAPRPEMLQGALGISKLEQRTPEQTVGMIEPALEREHPPQLDHYDAFFKFSQAIVPPGVVPI